ncbi:MAG: hypothetical protein WAN36_12290 [Calditrichia bacterium]
MKLLTGVFLIVFCISIHTAGAQSISLKPYFGYATLRMNDVNESMQNRIGLLRQITQQPLPFPEELNGNTGWGIMAEYRWEDDYFLNVASFYLSDKTSADRLDPGMLNYHFDRQVTYFEFSIGLHYFWNYSSWKRLNPYMGGAAGLGFGWTESTLQYSGYGNEVNDRSDFSSNNLTAYFCAGLHFRITTLFYLTTEAGYRHANMDQMEGKLQVYENLNNQLNAYTRNNHITETYYDFSGFYLTGGLGFVIPLFR